jgi:hypothetical protein
MSGTAWETREQLAAAAVGARCERCGRPAASPANSRTHRCAGLKCLPDGRSCGVWCCATPSDMPSLQQPLPHPPPHSALQASASLLPCLSLPLRFVQPVPAFGKTVKEDYKAAALLHIAHCRGAREFLFSCSARGNRGALRRARKGAGGWGSRKRGRGGLRGKQRAQASK